MTNDNPYQAYAEGNVLLSDNALDLVVTLYEGAIDAGRAAKQCLESGDVWGRTKAINKEVSILTELIISLNHEKGGEIASNLKKLYSYMQRRLIEAHSKRTAEPIEEVERLLGTMLDGWKRVAEESMHEAGPDAPCALSSSSRDREPELVSYGSYWNETAGVQRGTAYSF